MLFRESTPARVRTILTRLIRLIPLTAPRRRQVRGSLAVFDPKYVVAPAPLRDRLGGPTPPETMMPAAQSRLPHLRRAVLAFAAATVLAAGPAVAGEAELLAQLAMGGRVELPPLDPAVPTPESVLGYRLGERFTRYDDLRRYLAALAAASPRVEVDDYGTTYEGRPLTLVTITGRRNQERMNQIRRQRGQLADPAALDPDERERLAREAPAVVWLGYGVHGNESSSSEAAMAVAYVLAAAGGDWDELLDEVVVVLDPLSNPDGRERYVSAFEQRRGRRPDADPDAAEHGEPWPGGRGNHYGVDLNRDWAWATQRETRHRLAAYRAWEPQVYVDLHEMASESTYFFPPTAEPINPGIDPGVVRWLSVFGGANAEAFDRQGWLYYEAESFDLFYPGYGDSYPSFRGAVGMTYEVGGGGRGGLALRLADGSRVTLADRVARHLTASLATVQTAAVNRHALLADFITGRVAARERPATTYLWAAGQPEGAAMAALLARHGVEVRRLAADQALPLRDLAGGEPSPRPVAAGAWAVSTAQPLGGLVRTLLEPETPMPASYLAQQRKRVDDNLKTEFFDVTAWALPLAFNVATWVMEGAPSPASLAPAAELEADPPAAAAAESADVELPATGAGQVVGEGEVGYLIPPQGLAGYRAAARLAAAGVRLRVALDGFALPGGERFPAGTLVVSRTANPDGLDAAMAAVAAGDAGGAGGAGVGARRIGSSTTGEGVSLGSDRIIPVVPARIGLVGGPGVDPSSFGFLWHLFDRQVELPVTRLEGDRLGRLNRLDLAAFDVLILPDGDYGERFDDKSAAVLERWLRDGGLLVAVGDAIDWLQERKLTAVETWKPAAAPADDPEGARAEEPPQIVTPGAILATRLRDGHPLALGIPAPPPVLFEGSRILRPTGNPQTDVLTADPDHPVLAGVAWPEARERLAGALLVATEAVDRGRLVLFAQEPDFRLVWRGTAPLLLNAVLYGPSWGVKGED